MDITNWKPRIDNIPTVLRNKYIIACIAFFVWLLFFDQNNLIDRYKNQRHYQRLIDDRAYYIERIEDDNRRLKELRTNKENLEKFAREEYFMKKDNEDIFIIVEENE